jgi:hypothetical protein
MVEKRSFARLLLDWEIEFQMSKSESAQPIPIKGGIRDISAGGFSFRSESAYLPEALFKFAIKPKDSLKPMVGVARIAWIRGQEGSYESGARFVWLSWKDMDPQTAIAQFVLDLMVKRP